MTTKVRYLHSGMTGAPVLTGQAGKMIDVLDACLVNGWGSGVPDSIVIAGGIGTVTRAAGHPFEVDTVALLAGTTVSGGSINGEQRVLSITSTTWTFDATGFANQTASVVGTQKLAPLGFAKQYSDTNLAAYKITDVLGTAALLRVDDTGGVSARVVAYETMADVNTGTGPFPKSAQISGGVHWTKASSADATARPWVLIGDSRGFVLNIMHYAPGLTHVTMMFGDFQSRKSPDPYAAMLAGQSSAASTNPAGTAELLCSHTSSTAYTYAMRSWSGLGSSPAIYRASSSHFSSVDGVYSGGTSFTPFPNGADNSLILNPFTLGESTSYRGVLPGVYFCPQSLGSNFATKDKVTGVTGLSGRKLMALSGSGSSCTGFVDITGPWAR